MRKWMYVTTSVLFASTPALAAPILSGPYAVSGVLFCQIEAKVSSTGQLTIDNPGAGLMDVSSFVLTFDPGAGTYAVKGFGLQMSSILEKFADGSRKGLAPNFYPLVDSGSYSNTGTAIDFRGIPYKVVYGHINSDGVADGFTAMAKDGVEGQPKTCVKQITAQHQ